MQIRTSILAVSSRWTLMVVLALGVTACGKSNKAPQTPSSQSSATSETDTAPVSNADETTALANPQFSQALVLSLNIDGYDSTSKLQALGGVDNKNTYGATYEQTDFSGCGVDPNHLTSLNLTPGLDGDAVMAWLKHENLENVAYYTIRYPNAQSTSYGTSNTFYCPFLLDKIKNYLPADQKNNDIHHTLTLPLAHRVFDRWTYENRYDAQAPGQGTVKIFAGTFAYHLETALPGVSFGGQGTGTVKLQLNPDNGQWTTEDYRQQDPSIIFATQ